MALYLAAEGHSQCEDMIANILISWLLLSYRITITERLYLSEVAI